MSVTEAISSAARPVRLSRKCPPPGTNQARATAGSQGPAGVSFASCSCAAIFIFILACSGTALQRKVLDTLLLERIFSTHGLSAANQRHTGGASRSSHPGDGQLAVYPRGHGRRIGVYGRGRPCCGCTLLP